MYSLFVGLWLISMILTTRDKYLSGIVIIIYVAIVAIIIIVTSNIASSVIASAAAAISSAAYPIVSNIIVASSIAASSMLDVESASAMTLSSWTLDISYAINLLLILAVEGTLNIIRYVEDIRDMSTSNISADCDL